MNSELGADSSLQYEHLTGGRLIIAKWTVNWGQIYYCKVKSEEGHIAYGKPNSDLWAHLLLQTEQLTGGRFIIANRTENCGRLLIE